MKVYYNKSLKDLNTFGVDVKAKKIIEIESSDELTNPEVTEAIYESFLIVGGASNILFTRDLEETVIIMKTTGISIDDAQDDNYVYVDVESGVAWKDLVEYTTKQNILGLQNLADIPGTVGATPVQNVGAYGVEVKDFIYFVQIFDLYTNSFDILTNKECEFSYRDSIFKHYYKDRAIITSVQFILPKYTGTIPTKYLEYKGINEKVSSNDSLEKLYNTVREIRKEKLPSVEEYGSAGSTFKNPEVTKEEYEKLKEKYPELPSYSLENSDKLKIPAAYILERLGWKNKRIGNVGTWIYHPLIVTNYGNATGKEILSFIQTVQQDFERDTNIPLETEINIIY